MQPRIMKRNAFSPGPMIVLALSLAPLLFWAGMGPLASRFSSTMTTLTSIGQVTALVGIMLFSLTLILHARIRPIEGLFGGLDGVYRAHHLFGAAAFVLLLLHPLFLALRFISSSLRDALLFLLPGPYAAVNYGIAALALLAVLLLITFFASWKYQNWKRSHTLLAGAFFIAGLHAFFITSDVSRSMPLRVYILSFAMIGLLSFIARKAFRPLGLHEYAVGGVKMLTKDVVEITLSPRGKPLSHKAGQFAFVRFRSKSVTKEWHPFTISSGSGERNVRFTIKSAGDFTSTLRALKKGDGALLEGPYGRFCSDAYPGKDLLWIAGGIGITPFLSMARSSRMMQGEERVTLLYCVAKEDDAIALDEFKALAKARKGFEFHFHVTAKEGYITAEKIRKVTRDLTEREVFLCGPPPMKRSISSGLKKVGVPGERIHEEAFDIR